MTALDSMSANWADGPAVMALIDERVRLCPASLSERRRLERRRTGAHASFWDLDTLLTGLGAPRLAASR